MVDMTNDVTDKYNEGGGVGRKGHNEMTEARFTKDSRPLAIVSNFNVLTIQ